MRTIKFRGKLIGDDFRTRYKDGWIYGDYLKNDTSHFIINEFDEGSDNSGYPSIDITFWQKVIPKTVGQFINKKDKNGKKIFCQDILATKERDVVLMVVWDEETCGYKFKGNESSFNNLGLLDIDSGSLKAMEIIGNIHDNPELLEGSDQ